MLKKKNKSATTCYGLYSYRPLGSTWVLNIFANVISMVDRVQTMEIVVDLLSILAGYSY